MIINLHEMLGNRWSAIAARLPGRTDNEIKNVWHTHLKKRLTSPSHSDGELPKRKARPPQSKAAANQAEPNPVRLQQNTVEYASNPTMVMQTSSIQSSFDNSISDISSSSTSSSIAMETYDMGFVTNESTDSSSEELVELDQSFWNEALSMENCAAAAALMDATAVQGNNNTFSRIDEQLNSENDEDASFWLRIFMEAGGLNDLPEL